mmetsp:Transcript_94237/g.218926  ORF Transcript_94237/g.218926 Transcript_94237/m.218926 type:complete len:267 (-) Transcript_94237:16-816(-)
MKEEVKEEAKEEHIHIEVLLMSSAPLVAQWFPSSASVRSLLEVALAATDSHNKDAWLLLNNSKLDAEAPSLQSAGIKHGSVLTLVLQKRRLWSEPLLGVNARLGEESDDGVVVTRANGFFYKAVVIARYPASHFRVRVIDNTGRWSGALELGFTATHPDHLEGRIPADLANLPECFAVTHSGSLYGLETHTVLQNWNEDLRPNDVVKVAVLNAGLGAGADGTEAAEFVVEVDGVVKVRAALAHAAPELYPVVGVYGKTKAVELLET